MARRKTLKEVGNMLDDLSTCVTESKNVIEIAALEDAKRILLERIFTNNKTVDGSDFGTYSPSYFALRQRKNKGNSLRKNLIFDGNLKASIQQGVNGGKNVVGFTDLDLADIARYQEEDSDQIGESIFQLNQVELDAVIEGYNSLLLAKINSCLKRA